jgi:hypothetical protein
MIARHREQDAQESGAEQDQDKQRRTLEKSSAKPSRCAIGWQRTHTIARAAAAGGEAASPD